MTGQTQTKVSEMDKKQMAHAYALQMLATLKDCDKYVGGPDMRNIARNAWELADAMKDQELENAEAQRLWEPDWSQIPEWANWYCIGPTSCIGMGSVDRPLLNSEGGVYSWLIGIPDDQEAVPLSLFGYTGDWQNSLRKRPTL